MNLILSVLVLMLSINVMAADPMPSSPSTDAASEVELTYAKPTTKQTAAVSKAAVRAKKLNKKDK